MDITLFLIVICCYIFAAFVKGVTGLGFSTTCLSLLALIMGVKEALPLVLLPSLASNFFTMKAAGHFKETVSKFWPLFISAVPGLIIGLWILNTLDVSILGACLGLILIIYTIFAFAQPEMTLSAATSKSLMTPTGFFTGMINGMTGSQVMPVLPYLLALKLDPNRFVQAINCSFTLSTIVMSIGLTRLGIITTQAIMVSMCGLLFVYFGVWAGSSIRQKLPVDIFRKLVLGFLFILGLALLKAAV